MLTTSIILIVVLAAVAIIVTIVVKGRKSETVVVPVGDNRYETLEVKAMEDAEKMTVDEKADMLRRHSTDSWKCVAAEGVIADITALSITSINVHGTTFTSVKRAINKSVALTDVEALRLLTLDKELFLVRKEKFAASTNYMTGSSPLLGKVYAYRASKIAIEPKSGAASRIVIKINKLADNKVEVTDIYVAASDIRNAKSYDHYDMTKQDIVARFEALVLKNEKEYGDEIEELETILERVFKYNYLIESKLLKVQGSTFIFSIPTDAQLRHVIDMDIDMPDAVNTDSDDEEDANDLFEDVHSSQE